MIWSISRWMRPWTSVTVGGTARAIVSVEASWAITMFWAVALFGSGTIAFGLSTSFPLSLAALFTMGAADMVSVYVRQTLVQLATPDQMRGRVGAVSSVFIVTSNEFGDFRAGMVAAAIGVVPAVVLGGCATLAVTGLWSRLFPDLRKVERLDRVL